MAAPRLGAPPQLDPRAAVRLAGLPSNPPRALASALRAALGLRATPLVLRGGAEGLCFLSSVDDRATALAAGHADILGVRVLVSALDGGGSVPMKRKHAEAVGDDTTSPTTIDEGPADDAPDEPDTEERIRRALLGMQAGDAIAAPIHWYYSIDVMRRHLREHFGCEELREYAAVPASLRGKHPDSWSYMKAFDPTKAATDIVHEKKALWNEPGHFYHSELAAGEVTHTVSISLLLLRSIAEDGGYDWEKYTQRYLDFWRTPGRNSDTYVEIVHRHFFERLATGAPLHGCGMEESCLSGFAVVMPLVLAMHAAPESEALAAMEAHLRLTHNSDALVKEARLMARTLRAVRRPLYPFWRPF
jgi:hypothetical protein